MYTDVSEGGAPICTCHLGTWHVMAVGSSEKNRYMSTRLDGVTYQNADFVSSAMNRLNCRCLAAILHEV